MAVMFSMPFSDTYRLVLGFLRNHGHEKAAAALIKRGPSFLTSVQTSDDLVSLIAASRTRSLYVALQYPLTFRAEWPAALQNDKLASCSKNPEVNSYCSQ